MRTGITNPYDGTTVDLNTAFNPAVLPPPQCPPDLCHLSHPEEACYECDGARPSEVRGQARHSVKDVFAIKLVQYFTEGSDEVRHSQAFWEEKETDGFSGSGGDRGL